MTRYARIVDGAVVETRNFGIAPDPNPAKGLDWRLCPSVAQPSYSAALERVTGPTYSVGETEVTEQWGTERRSLGEQQAAVKAEAQRRIIALTGTNDLTACMIKQSNANMRANELNDKRLNGETLTEGEETEAQALRDLATAIKAIRAKSNDIELLDPIPLDYTADSYWQD